MKPIVTLLAPGGMGAALAKRLVENGVEVRTSLNGRSEETKERALAAGMRDVEGRELVEVDILLSVVPPVQALPLAEHMRDVLKAAVTPPIYVDCNAVNTETAAQISAVIEGAGCPFVDGGLIGMPPREGYAPTLFVSGPQAEKIAVLNDYGFVVSVMDGPVGAASSLKMAYAGITKGLIGIATSMILAAERGGVGADLRKELAKSQSQLFASFGRSIPDMFSKAERWAPEMAQIAGFVGEDAAATQLYDGFEALYERLGNDNAGEGEEGAILRQFFAAEDGIKN